MRYEVAIENIILTCDVHSYIKKSPDFNSWASDVDFYGTDELDYTIERVLELDEDNLPFELTIKESDAILCGLENIVKTKLILEIERENEE